jgi:hypothetical protein
MCELRSIKHSALPTMPRLCARALQGSRSIVRPSTNGPFPPDVTTYDLDELIYVLRVLNAKSW